MPTVDADPARFRALPEPIRLAQTTTAYDTRALDVSVSMGAIMAALPVIATLGGCDHADGGADGC